LAAFFSESWDGGLHGWAAGMSGRQLTVYAEGGPQGGPFARYTDDQGAGDDTNHYDGIGAIHLGPYAYLGNYEHAGVPSLLLGGGLPDLRGATFRAQLRGVSWRPRGTELVTWIQASREPRFVDLPPDELRYPNWANTGAPQGHLLRSGAWEVAEWTLRSRTSDWTFAGTYGGRLTYDYGELDSALSAVDVDIFALQMIGVDIFDQPRGSWDIADLHITYRQNSLLVASNGGSLVSAPAGDIDEATLTDGWRHGAGREWHSQAFPAEPLVFVYALATPCVPYSLTVHNAVQYPSREIEVDVSDDGGQTWFPVLAGELEDSHPLGPNYNFLNERRWELVDGDAVWAPLHPVAIDRVRIRVLSGHQEEAWGLGEIEVFGTGAVVGTEDAWYDLSQDVLVPEPGSWHFRVVAESAAGQTTGPAQLIELP
jgi:hypothetical protein